MILFFKLYFKDYKERLWLERYYVGDKVGFVPDLNTEEACELILKSIENSGYNNRVVW